MIKEFNYLPIRKVYYGEGAAANINTILDEAGSKRPLIVTSASVSRTNFYEKLLSSLKVDFAEFKEITQHSPLEEIEHATELYRNRNCDAVISVGGGSVIDSSKLIRHYFASSALQIAVPTTLSAAEFSHIAGYTLGGEKNGVRDKEITPQYVILDPVAAMETPEFLWRTTGIRALDHAVETLISPNVSEMSEILALEAISKLIANLPGNDIKSKMESQLAAWYSYFQVFDASMGLSHNIGKVIGAKWEIPHGVTSCITLPRVMEHYAHTKPEKMAKIASHLGFTGNTESELAMKAADIIGEFVIRLGLARTLSSYGIKEEDLDYIISNLKGEQEGAREILLEML